MDKHKFGTYLIVGGWITFAAGGILCDLNKSHSTPADSRTLPDDAAVEDADSPSGPMES